MNIYDRRIPFWARPLRSLYRVMKRWTFPSHPRLKQVRRSEIDYLVWTNEEIGQKLLLLRSYEKEEINIFRDFIAPGDVCFDLGANVGFYSLNFARFCGPDGEVYAFEPVPRNVTVIKLAAMINGFENISIYEGVAFDTEGDTEVEFFKDSAYAHISADASPQEVVRISVKSTTLDTFVKEWGINDIAAIKIDVEGAEYKVLLGARDILGDSQIQPKLLMVELCSMYLARFDSNIEDVVNLMKNYGYLPYVVDSRGGLNDYSSDKVDKYFNVFFITK